MKNYSEFVMGLAKPGEHIIRDIDPKKAHLLHMASCIMGEAGELFDAIKKHHYYGKALDRENIIEELGDIEFYMEGLRSALGISRDHTINENMIKLEKRYPNGYTDKSAIERADKV